MNGMPMMQKPKENTWEELAEQLTISIANSKKSLMMAEAQLREVESHIKKE